MIGIFIAIGILLLVFAALVICNVKRKGRQERAVIVALRKQAGGMTKAQKDFESAVKEAGAIIANLEGIIE